MVYDQDFHHQICTNFHSMMESFVPNDHGLITSKKSVIN